MHSLPLFHRIAGTRVVVVGDGAMAAAKRRLVERAGATCCSEAEAHHTRLAFVALEDADLAVATAARLKARGLLVNVADRPELCDFTLPSVLDRDPVLVAVSTGGASAGLAKQLRLRLEAMLPSRLGALADALSKARDAMRERFPDGAERRRALDDALSAGSALDPLVEHDDESVARWLKQGRPEANGVIEILLTGDDPDDLTLRQARALGTADLVLHDVAVSPAILSRARADAVRTPLDTIEPPADARTVILRLASPQAPTSSADTPSSEK